LLAFAEAKKVRATYHLGGPERISRFQFGLKIAAAFGLDASRIVAASSSDPNFNRYPRPKDCSLSNAKLKKAFHAHFASLAAGLKDMGAGFSKQAGINLESDLDSGLSGGKRIIREGK
jgi:dTDP-4-dehydrorhamnose reductase